MNQINYDKQQESQISDYEADFASGKGCPVIAHLSVGQGRQLKLMVMDPTAAAGDVSISIPIGRGL